MYNCTKKRLKAFKKKTVQSIFINIYMNVVIADVQICSAKLSLFLQAVVQQRHCRSGTLLSLT